MKRLRWKIIFYSVLISLPAVLTVGGGAAAVVTMVPDAIRAEPARIGRIYREKAEELIAKPEIADYVGARRKGWQAGRKIGSVGWGYLVEGEKACVWYHSGPGEWRARQVDAERAFPYAAVFYFGGAAVAVLIVALAVLAVWHFVNLNAERESLIKDKEDFIAATVHDLTTPLVSMRHLIGVDDDEASSLNERMIRLVKNLKEFMRLGGRRSPELQNFDAVAVCRRAYRLFKSDYEDVLPGGVEFTGLDALAVRADEMMTEQIFWNLLGNNLKYAAQYGPVTVDFSAEGTKATVKVIDNGPGISEEEMGEVFTRYYRAASARRSGKGGFGVGLCTALEFARAMGGDLKVSANHPRGCVFTLELPLAEHA